MKPTVSFLSQPIRSLQTMIRTIAIDSAQIPSVVPDGIYGSQTLAAVSAFQRLRGLPVTGITNRETWNAIASAYGIAKANQFQAQEIPVVLNAKQVFRMGDAHHTLYFAQAMLTVLSQAYANIGQPVFSGNLDAQSADSIRDFQKLCALPITGELDKLTWKHLVLQYSLAANRGTS